MRVSISILSIVAGLLVLGPSMMAQDQDVEGSKDHPLFSRMPNFVIGTFEEKEYDAAKFLVEAKGGFKRVDVEGKRTMIFYHTKPGLSTPPSMLQVARNYINAATKIGGKIMFEGKGKEWTDLNAGGLSAMYDVTMKFTNMMVKSGRASNRMARFSRPILAIF